MLVFDYIRLSSEQEEYWIKIIFSRIFQRNISAYILAALTICVKVLFSSNNIFIFQPIYFIHTNMQLYDLDLHMTLIFKIVLKPL